MTYSEKLRDPRWQRKRLEILNRDDFTCRDCGDKDHTLHIHHCLYGRGKEPWEAPADELRTLCEECHEERSSIEHDVKLEFSRLLARLRKDQISELMPQILGVQERYLDVYGVSIMATDEHNSLADLRWLQYALKFSEARKFYEEVTKNEIPWEALF